MLGARYTHNQPLQGERGDWGLCPYKLPTVPGNGDPALIPPSRTHLIFCPVGQLNRKPLCILLQIAELVLLIRLVVASLSFRGPLINIYSKLTTSRQ